MLKLKPCTYTGVPTVQRREDGEPALTEGAIRSAYAHDPKFVEACAKEGFGVRTDDTPTPSKRKR